jgi:hypothetical protein
MAKPHGLRKATAPALNANPIITVSIGMVHHPSSQTLSYTITFAKASLSGS